MIVALKFSQMVQTIKNLNAWKEKEKKENLAEIARLEQNLENLRVSLSYAIYEQWIHPIGDRQSWNQCIKVF